MPIAASLSCLVLAGLSTAAAALPAAEADRAAPHAARVETISAPTPQFIYESMLDVWCHDASGLMRFGDVELAFAPEPPFVGAVAVVDGTNTIIARFDYFPDYVVKEGVFARARVQGPAEVSLTKPGVYNIVYLIENQPVSRLPVVVEEKTAGDDPFNPQKTYQFFGLWQRYAHITINEWKEQPFPVLTFWAGARDLGDTRRGEGFVATLSRDGVAVGHSIAQQGSIEDTHYRRVTTSLYEPHEEKNSANAVPLLKDAWMIDGDYELTIARRSDGTIIRIFAYTAKDGRIEPLSETALDFEPAIDRITPRVSRKNRTLFEFHEAIWIRAK